MGEFADEAVDRCVEGEMFYDIPAESYKCRLWRPYKMGESMHSEHKVGDKCPATNCKGKLVRRRNRESGREFLGCSAFPKCRKSFSTQQND